MSDPRKRLMHAAGPGVVALAVAAAGMASLWAADPATTQVATAPTTTTSVATPTATTGPATTTTPSNVETTTAASSVPSTEPTTTASPTTPTTGAASTVQPGRGSSRSGTAGAGTAADAPRSYSYRDRYAVLSEQNIFMKERRRSSSASSGGSSGSRPTFPSGDSTRRPPEASYVLTGVVIEEGELRAYIEDMNAGRIVRLVVGDAVSRGKITHIEIDAITYESGGQATVIPVGKTLSGAAASTASSSSASAGVASTGADATTTSTTGPTTAAAINPNDPNLTMEQKMKLRRMQELQK